MKSPVRAACVLLLTASASAAGNVLRVGATQPYRTIQAAVNAAQTGDLVLVDAGNYPPFVVNAVGVGIMSASAAPFTVTASNSRPAVSVTNISAAQSVTIAGWQTSVTFGAAPALSLSACAGPVRIQDATLTPAANLIDVPMTSIVLVANCRSAIFDDVDVFTTTPRLGRTTNGISAPGGVDRGIAAVVAISSNAHFNRCRLRGYDNLGAPATGRWGGDALRLFGNHAVRMHDRPTGFVGGAGGEFGGSAVHQVDPRPIGTVLSCGVPNGAFQRGSAPKPGGFFAINHDRGLVGNFIRIVPACIFESAGFVRAAPRAAIHSSYRIDVSSFFSRAFVLLLGPSRFLSISGIENTGFVDLASPLTLILAVGALPSPALSLPIPNAPGLIGYQFATQAILGPPTTTPGPPLSWSLGSIAVITP